MGVPDVANVREWQMRTIRAVAGPSPGIREAQIWVMQAMGPTVPKEALRGPGRFPRLDLVTCTNLIEEFAKFVRSRNLSVHRQHFLAQMRRMEFAAQNEKRLLTGREMIGAICYWCSVRSERGQHRISRDSFKVVMDPNRPDADLCHFYNEWADVYASSSMVYDPLPTRCEL
eukprot:6360046-Pyramimonas_sp.AAC.1